MKVVRFAKISHRFFFLFLPELTELTQRLTATNSATLWSELADLRADIRMLFNGNAALSAKLDEVIASYGLLGGH